MNENQYYVYLHRRKDNDAVFYIGKGKGRRHLDKKNRNQEWHIINNSVGFYSEVYKENMTNEEAHLLEYSLISDTVTYPQIINKRKCNVMYKDIPEDVVSRYILDNKSPSGISKVKKNGEIIHLGSIMVRYKSREPAGWFIHYNSSTKIAAHRLVIYLSGIKLSKDDVVNHINSNTLDNRLENLEVCSISENNQRNRITTNLKMSPNNSSGVTGVCEVTNNNKGRLYIYAMAMWSVDSKTRSKKFSYNKYGKEQAWDLAKEYRNRMVLIHYKGNNQ